jgi:hypothetical protein
MWTERGNSSRPTSESDVRFEVLVEVITKIIVFPDVTPYSLVSSLVQLHA